MAQLILKSVDQTITKFICQLKIKGEHSAYYYLSTNRLYELEKKNNCYPETKFSNNVGSLNVFFIITKLFLSLFNT